MTSASPAALCVPLLAKLFSADRNVALSPYSIAVALSMVAGASTEGSPLEGELLKFFGTASVTELKGAAQKLQAHLGGEGSALSQGNGMWVRGRVHSDFVDDFLKVYQGAQVAELTTRAPINEFVDKATKGKITEILEDEPDARMKAILVNAIHYKANWSSQFDSAKNTTGSFGDVQKEVVYMNQKTSAEHALLSESDVGCKAELLALNQGERYKAAFIVPRTADLATLVNSIASGKTDFRTLVTSATPVKEVQVSIPKFSVDSGCMDITRTLSSFVPSLTTNLLKRLTDEDVVVSGVIHRCTVDVNEEGAEAAAATAVMMRCLSLEPEPLVFKCDRPFLFTIFDSQQAEPLFLAAVNSI